jgi:integrase
MRHHKRYTLLAHTTKDGATVYYARFYDPKTGRRMKKSTGETTIGRARTIAEGFLAEKEAVQGKDDPLFLEHLKDFWRDAGKYAEAKKLRGKPLSARYLELQRQAIRLYVEPFKAFEGVRVSHLTPKLAEDWLSWLDKEGKGARSINIALQMVRVAVRRWARLLRLQDPLAGVDKVAETPRTRGVLSIDEVRKLLAVRKDIDERARAGVLLALLAGLRLGECRGLRWEDVDQKGGKLTIRHAVGAYQKDMTAPKWGSTGEVPAPEILLDELRSLARKSPFGREGFVLYGTAPEEAVGTERLVNGFLAMLRKIKVDETARQARNLSFHSLRHTYVSLSRLSGIPDFLVQRYARHKSPGMMEQYSHAQIVDFEDARKRLSAAVKPKRKAAGK